MWVWRWFGLALVLAVVGAAEGERASAKPETAQVVMLSDIHFDPFLDPGKVVRLQAAPVSAWAQILNGPDTAGRAEAFEVLHKACGPRGADASLGLLRASLTAARSRVRRPAFVTVSGDLMAHEVECRLKKLMPGTDAEAVSTFGAKVTAFVAGEVRRGFVGVPVYLALGNNDSACGDYKETRGSAYLQAAGRAFAAGVPAGRGRRAVLAEFADEGEYSVALPSPLVRGRIISMQNIFASRRFTACDLKKDTTAAEAQVAWLRGELAGARARRERVWVMMHVPPGVDVYATVHPYALKPAELCAAGKPATFLGSEAVVDVLAEFADVVKLVVLGHSHEDELRLLTRGEKSLVAKVVPSISPVNGNHASFTIAEVERDAGLRDYTVVTAEGPLLEPTKWDATYSFRATYGVDGFTVAALSGILKSMATHVQGTVDSAAALAYERWFFPGDQGIVAAGLEMFWPAYRCSLGEDRAEEYWQCACGAAK